MRPRPPGPTLFPYTTLFRSLPRVRDFKGVPADSFDGRGNYAMGIKEQLVFPEISYDKIEKVRGDRKSTRLNSSHVSISYAVFCLKKKIKTSLAWSASTSIIP